jgi:DNA-binding FrmR family transcriptional regulator
VSGIAGSNYANLAADAVGTPLYYRDVTHHQTEVQTPRPCPSYPGPIDAIERALEAEIGCTDVLMLVASVRGAITGLTTELLEDHIRHHVVDPAHEKDPEKAKGAADLIDVVRTYLK